MIYTAQRTAFAKPVTWRLEDGALFENERRLDFATLRSAQIGKGRTRPGQTETVLLLQFGRRRVLIPSHRHIGLAGWVDQGESFRPFARTVLANAAIRAPDARYSLAGGLDLGAYGAAMCILGLGMLLVLVAAIVAGQVSLGLDIGSRLAFALLLMLCPMPWLAGGLKRRFSPLEPPL